MTDFSGFDPFPTPPDPANQPTVECWRCGKQRAAAASNCPFCGALGARSAGEFTVAKYQTARDDAWSPVAKLIGYFGALLFTSIVFAAILQQRFGDDGVTSDADRIWLLHAMIVVEVIDTIIVVVALSTLGRPGTSFDVAPRAVAWTAAGPALALLLAANFAYHWTITRFVTQIEPERLLPGYELLILASYCVQPAIVEELFFRGMALDWFRTAMTTRGALVVSSVMFGIAHVYAPGSVPYLIVAGLVFGAARILSNGLLLPIVLHFAHNLAVVFYEHYSS